MIKTIKDKTPVLGQNCYVAETAAVVGDVVMGNDCSVWYSAVIRGDMEQIRIGDRVNVQDCSVIHVTPGFGDVIIGNDVTIGHNATIHGAKIEDNVLIGMGATLLDNCHVGRGAIIAAGALILKNTQIGPGEVWGGVPAKCIKQLSEGLGDKLNKENALHYVEWTPYYIEENQETGINVTSKQ